MIRGKPIRVLAAVAVVVLAGLAVAALSADRSKPPAVADMNHGDVRFAKGEESRILNAVEAANAGTPADELVAEGRKLFRDVARFEDGESCETCHSSGSASDKLGQMVHDTAAADTLTPRPPKDFDGPRDPPSLWGLEKTPPFFWNGDVATLTAAIMRPIKGHMKKFVTGTCSGDNATTQPCVDEAGGLAASLVAYVKTLDPPTTSFDEGTMSSAALAGEKLFQGKAGCIECHGGPLFTDNSVHNTGVPQVDFTSPYTKRLVPCASNPPRPNDPAPVECDKPDLGAPAPPLPPECTGPNPVEGCEPDPRQAGSAFINTPHLRDVRNSSPYMHNGAMKTLREVVDFYNNQSAVSPLNLSPAEVTELVAYLEAL
ncbi:MAG: cytochrome c peroxidase [Solirubrobacteraceae bacterium]|nr:cytochrome c peroxidase [Solirubrobacteraceae bacterium]